MVVRSHWTGNNLHWGVMGSQQLCADLDRAKSLLNAALGEKDPERQRNLAMMAQTAAGIALTEATWLGRS